MTGFGSTRLIAGLIELRSRVTDWTLFDTSPSPACPRCTRRYPGGPVHRLLLHHGQACPRHRLWIGSRGYTDVPSDRFVDISEAPAVLAAQRTHRRLVLRHGPANAYDGLVLARNFLRQVDVPRPAPQTQEILDVLCRHGPLLFLDPAYGAARYPRLIHLAALFISPRWRTLATRYDTWPRFFAELSTRCFGHPGYVPHGNNAVSKWLSRQTFPRPR